MAKTATAKTTRKASPDPPIGNLQHAEGCPAEREEAYRDRRPNGEPVIVSRCLDCPAHRADSE